MGTLPMRRISRLAPRLAPLFAAGMLALPMPAQALSWHWSFLRPAAGGQPAIDARGRLRTTAATDASGFHTITAVSGHRNGVAITSFLPAGTAIPGNCLSASQCYEADNLLRQGDLGPGQLTSHGFGVGFADGTFANYFNATFLTPAVDMEYFSAPPFNTLPPEAEDSELTGLFAATPVPGPLPMSGGLLAMGWARRLRRRLLAGVQRPSA